MQVLLHEVPVVEREAVSTAGCVTIAVSLPVHPLASVTTTTKVSAQSDLIEVVVPPWLHA